MWNSLVLASARNWIRGARSCTASVTPGTKRLDSQLVTFSGSAYRTAHNHYSRSYIPETETKHSNSTWTTLCLHTLQATQHHVVTTLPPTPGRWHTETAPQSWGSSHEGSGRHPRQHGGGRGRRFSKFMANSHRVCSLLRPSFCELIVNVMGHIDAEFWAAVIRHFTAIPA